MNAMEEAIGIQPPPADVHGWTEGLEELYAQMAHRLPDGASWVEVGVWQGKSLIFAALETKRLGKRIQFIAVDHFRGSAEHEGMIPEGGLRAAFEDNLIRYGVDEVVAVWGVASFTAARLCDDDSLDFVFIDGSHDFASVAADIRAWLPKVKQNGGVLAGHDWNRMFGSIQSAVKQEIDAPVQIIGDCWVYTRGQEKPKVSESETVTLAPSTNGTTTAAAMAAGQRVEHKTIFCPRTWEAVAASIDKLEAEGWEYVDHFDVEIEMPSAPAGNLRGEQAQGGALLYLSGEARPTQKVAGHALVFKRPKEQR